MKDFLVIGRGMYRGLIKLGEWEAFAVYLFGNGSIVL
jgi:hypothetical protein